VAKPVRTREALLAVIENLRDCIVQPRRRLVIVHPDRALRDAWSGLLALEGVDILAVPTLSMAAERLRAGDVDCLVLGSVPEEEIRDVLGAGGLDAAREIPLVAYGPPEWGDQVQRALTSCGTDLVVVPVGSPERLLDQCALRLHRAVAGMSDRQRQILQDLHQGTTALAGRKVLIVDDDIRNIFALTSVLERQDMTIVSAETGRDAVQMLEKSLDIDVVLMDVMMPEMDGFETTRAIRDNPAFRRLPIIAVTAKAMKGDREKCLEAGASDYLAKPVDPEELVAKLRDWLFR
jgi:CheY-like chemotaxis protein